MRFLVSPLLCSSLPYDAYYILFVCLGLSFRLPFSTFIYFLLILPIKKVSNSSGTIAV